MKIKEAIDLTREVLNMAISALEEQGKTGLLDKSGREIQKGDKVKGLFLYAEEIIGTCEYSKNLAAWGIRWQRGDVEEFTPFCQCCNVEWEVIDND